MTGAAGDVFVFCFPFFRRLFSSWTRSSRTLASLSWAPSSKCVPHYFVDFFSGFSGLAAFFSFFLWVGGLPLPRFPCVFPLVLGRVGVAFLVFSFPAVHSCILLLLFRTRIRQPGVRARKPPGPHRACT